MSSHWQPIGAVPLLVLMAAVPALGDLFTDPSRTAEQSRRAPSPDPPQEGVVRLGATAPLTGPRQGAGAILWTAQKFLARRGTANLILEDDGSMPIRTLSAARNLEGLYQIRAFLSPLETYPVGGLFPYLVRTNTPTLFISTTVSQWATGPRVIGFPPTGAGMTRVLADALRQTLEEHRQAQREEPRRQGIWVFWSDTADGRDRVAGFRGAGLRGVREVALPADGLARMPGSTLPAAVVLIGSSGQVVELARRIARLPTACETDGAGLNPHRSTSPCAPIMFVSVFEPFDWAELADPALDGAVTVEWLPADAATRAWHRRELAVALPELAPSRLTLWGHALAEITAEVIRRAGPRANGVQLLGAAESLRHWRGRLLPPVTLGREDHWTVEHVRLVMLTGGSPAPRSGWIPVARP